MYIFPILAVFGVIMAGEGIFNNFIKYNIVLSVNIDVQIFDSKGIAKKTKNR